ncbi:MFS transporter [Geodermatophilus sp. CPCC 206100]|uniref:MFS transporter n=1 Tax=Geodermatophilus sp. CPCC 206100 TaxID=3020054 RepID=UPI003B00FA5B
MTGGAGRGDVVLGGRTAWVVLVVGQAAGVVAVLQRSSLGVAATDAFERFGIAAATLATFSVAQLVVYALMQVPVGVLIDRYGSRRLIVTGALVMAAAQAAFAVSGTLPAAIAARMVLGVGDALVFISVMRLVPAWFPPSRSGTVTTAVGPMNSLGFVVSGLAFAAVLPALGWTPSFLLAALVSVASALAVLALVRDSPSPRPPRVPLARALGVAASDLREAWREPGTRLAFWLNFLTLFPGMMFGVLWGFPFLVEGQGVSPGFAGALLTVLAVTGVVYGASVGPLVNRHPYHRSLIGIGLVGLVGAMWGTVLLWPGPAPRWLLVVLVLVIPLAGVAAIVTFDLARTANPPRRLGAAIGMVNAGGFLGTLLAVLAIGLVLQAMTPEGSTEYSLGAFKWAFATQYLLWAGGAVLTLRYRRQAVRALAERDPAALEALRRGVHLTPPT